jgi:hypothetical protein
MSKTYRNRDWPHVNKSIFLEKEYDDHEYKYVYRKKSKAKYDADVKAKDDYLAKNPTRVIRHWTANGTIEVVVPNHLYVSRKYIVKVHWSREEQDEHNSKRYDAYFRDGGMGYETSRNTGFKKEAGKLVRRKNKKVCHQVIHDNDDWEHKPYPSRKDGKHCRWNWW